MEEMNNQVLENVEVAVEEVTNLTLGEKMMGYTLVGLTAVGAITVGIAAVKGATSLYKNLKAKKENKNGNDEAVVDIEDTEIQEVDEDESEEN